MVLKKEGFKFVNARPPNSSLPWKHQVLSTVRCHQSIPQISFKSIEILSHYGHFLILPWSESFSSQLWHYMLAGVPVDGRYSQWSWWSRCDRWCGGGTQTRSRWCNNPPPQNGGKECSRLGKSTITRKCNTHGCPGIVTAWGNVETKYKQQKNDGKTKFMQTFVFVVR